MITPLNPMDRLGEAKECWVLVNEYGAITSVRLTPPDDTKYPEQWRWQRFVAQDFAPNVNPLDREAWEKRVGCLAVLYRNFAFAEAGLGNSRDSENERWAEYAPEKSRLVDDILALQSQLTEALAEVERLRGIKEQWEAMAGPVLEFGQENSEALGIRLGDSIMDKVLQMLHEKARQPK